MKDSGLAQRRGLDWGYDQGKQHRQSLPKLRREPACPGGRSAVGEPELGPRMSIVLPVATAYLVYVVLGAVLVYVLVVHAIRVDERAAMVDLDRELRELVRAR